MMTEAIKLVLVDLDGTLWDGILLEDGLDGIRLDPIMVDRLRALDDMGILLAIVSKNHPDDVASALESFGLSALFAASEVSFAPKSTGVGNLLRLMRFAPEACVFVDDTAFEREEVAHAFPGMRVVTPGDFIERFPVSGGWRDGWAVASTPEEGLNRKRFYRGEQTRRRAEDAHPGAFRDFLRQSGLLVKVGRPSEQSVARISEITLRTNQINFSTNRYDPDGVRQLLASPRHESFLASATDRYGAYGVIGFACLRDDGDQVTIQDLMVSCRIQGKGVEAAIISVLAERARLKGGRRLIGLYRPTRRNGHILGVFPTLGFTAAGDDGEYQRFELDLAGPPLARPSHIQVIFSDTIATENDAGIPFVRDLVARHAADGWLRGTILDIGAGWDGVLGEDCDRFLEVNGNRHVRLDMARYPRTDIVADAQDMRDIADESHDSVLCLEVLEHCTDPFALSRELIRVLRTGGIAIVSAPMNFPIHDTPGDYWRFTPDGLKLLFQGRARVVSEHLEGENEHPLRTVLVLRK